MKQKQKRTKPKPKKAQYVSRRVGDWVTWTSSAGGGTTTKIGQIVKVVPPGEDPPMHSLEGKHKAISRFGGGWARNHASYVVFVKDGDRKPKLYWPRVRQLGKAAAQ